MRITIIRTPSASQNEEMQLSQIEVSHTYDVGFRTAELMLAEGSAEVADRADDMPGRARKKKTRKR